MQWIAYSLVVLRYDAASLVPPRSGCAVSCRPLQDLVTSPMVGRPSLHPKAQKGHAMLFWVFRRIYVCIRCFFSPYWLILSWVVNKKNTYLRGSPEIKAGGGEGRHGGRRETQDTRGEGRREPGPREAHQGGGGRGGGGTQGGRDARSITGGLSRCGCRRDKRTVAEKAMQPPLGEGQGRGGKGQTDTRGHPCPYRKGGHQVAERFPFPLTLGE